MKKSFYIFFIFILFSCEKDKSSIIKNDEIKKDDENIFSVLKNELSYNDKLKSGLFSKLETPNIDFSFIKASNCSETTEYSFPDYLNMHMGLPSDFPDSIVENNYITDIYWGMKRIILKKDINTKKDITIIASDGTNKYIFPNEIFLEKIPDDIYDWSSNVFYGYYFDFNFEHKPWFNNNINENVWEVVVKSGDDEIISENIKFNFSYLLFKELNNSPFVINNLDTISLNNEYTYRFKTEDADIIVIYFDIGMDFNEGGTIYRPILCLLPDSNNEKYTDIQLMWKSEQLIGKYHIRKHKFNEYINRGEFVFDTFNVVQ